MASVWPPRLFIERARPPLLDEKTRAMIEHLAEHKSALQHDREEVSALSKERARLEARIEQLQAILRAAGLPIPPDDDPD